MPLLKFICKDCNHTYEELTSADSKPPCPKCGSENVSRHYSGKCYFGATSGGGGTAGSCAGGSCSTCSGCGS